MDQGRVAIDTGAYASGRLTAAVVTDGDIHFETT
jgi:serine/threonine protein phosphatase 1